MLCCAVDASEDGPVALKKRLDGKHDFFVRAGSTCRSLNSKEVLGYVKTRWPGRGGRSGSCCTNRGRPGDSSSRAEGRTGAGHTKPAGRLGMRTGPRRAGGGPRAGDRPKHVGRGGTARTGPQSTKAIGQAGARLAPAPAAALAGQAPAPAAARAAAGDRAPLSAGDAGSGGAANDAGKEPADAGFTVFMQSYKADCWRPSRWRQVMRSLTVCTWLALPSSAGLVSLER